MNARMMTAAAIAAMVLGAGTARAVDAPPVCETQPKDQVPQSGQTACSDVPAVPNTCAGSDQNAETKPGLAHHFTDNGNGTVTDALTGLMWEKLDDSNLPGLAGIHDQDNVYTWALASVKVADLNGSTFGGHTDWRLPNIKELESLRNIGAVAPAVFPAFDTVCAPGCKVATCSCTPSNSFWSSTVNQDPPTMAWASFFGAGHTGPIAKAQPCNVRAVRTAP